MRWRALVEYLAQELQARRRSDVEEASHDRALEQWIVSSAALAYNGPRGEACGPALPRSVRRAMDFIAAHSRERVALSQIAAHAGVSARALQVAFARHLGETPMGHLRTVRLAKARSALLAMGRRPGAVTRAALAEGFSHLGEFAAAYRRAYGETPSETPDRS
jgi:transcriptional regulator GlxA family with amidase domain